MEKELSKIRRMKNIGLTFQISAIFLYVMFHLLKVLFYYFTSYNNLINWINERDGLDLSNKDLYWFGFNMLNLRNQNILLDTLLYVAIGLQILSIIAWIYLFRLIYDRKQNEV